MTDAAEPADQILDSLTRYANESTTQGTDEMRL